MPKPSKTTLISISILILLVASYFLVPSVEQNVNEAFRILTSGDRERVTEYVEAFGWWGPVIVILLMVVQMFLIVVPSWLLMIVAILAYGPWWGGLIAILAVVSASTVGYWVGRWLGTNGLSALLSESTTDKLHEQIDEHGIMGVLLFRIAPFLSNDGISFVAGAFKMGYFRFMLATLAGIIPLTALIAYFVDDLDTLKTNLAWFSGISLAAYVVYKLVQRSKKQED